MKIDSSYPQSGDQRLIAVPLVLAVLLSVPILVLGVHLDRSFNGSSLVMVQGLENLDSSGAKSAVENLFGSRVDLIFIENGFQAETDMLNENEENNYRWALATQLGASIGSVTIESMGPTVSGTQSGYLLCSIIGAFVGMGVVSLIIFRRRIVPIAILLVVGLDVLGVLGYMALLSVPLGLVSVVGIVMLIGYAADTNILLAWGILKRVGGEPRENMTDAIKTGVMMSALTLVVLLSVNVLMNISQLRSLTAVLIFGLAINILNTWLLGAKILLRHAERRRGREYHVGV